MIDDPKALPAPLLARPPFPLELSRWLVRRRLRGSTRLLRFLRERGLFDACVEYPLGNGVTCTLPLYREPDWDARDLALYEHELVAWLAAFVRRAAAPVTLIDCGADIGLVSLKVAAVAPVARIVAFEPNPVAYPILAYNLARLGPAHVATRAGVADRAGQGVLLRPDHDPDSPHAAFVRPVDRGDFPLTTVDALGLEPGGAIALKIDVEGGEAAVVRGALETLRAASGFAVTYEAHPAVTRRTGIEPLSIVATLQALGPVDVAVVEAPDLAVRLDRPLFEQLPPTRTWNVVVETAARRSDAH